MAAGRATLFRCQLCRLSAFAGRRSHLYSAGHQRRLRAALARLGEKVAAARAAVRRAEVLPFQAGEHERRVWCPCCAREVRSHLSRGARTVLHGGLLEHLASPEHERAVAAFWRKNRADPKQKADFLLSAAEYRRFQDSLCQALDAYEEKEDAAIQQAAAHIRDMEQKRREMVQAILEETGGEGNIHTGAKPPWLMNEEEEGERQIGPSYEEFLKEKQKQKLKQLPANRVGANFDHSSQTGDGWLPSFGRVWNHGRRWQSRHQFKAESGNKQPGSKRKRPRTS
ncbi:centrosomal AT-AC splicing factor isoform X2 [Ahaetulla prasina]|uniref:centrosomal AT-AC splicing factor isoform X2 n=1 Tax=Ahaetulla prasina TaxID=499056 RepID=UPI002649810B|nr:centrosomal AT-AC splicing factor isoform X2 [Ahaetulla prasina]